jgi:hypothetical protein
MPAPHASALRRVSRCNPINLVLIRDPDLLALAKILERQHQHTSPAPATSSASRPTCAVNQHPQPINDILIDRQPILAMSDLPGNELHGDLFLQLGLSGANFRIVQQTLSRLGCSCTGIACHSIRSRGICPSYDALHETFASRVIQTDRSANQRDLAWGNVAFDLLRVALPYRLNPARIVAFEAFFVLAFAAISLNAPLYSDPPSPSRVNPWCWGRSAILLWRSHKRSFISL